jgi:hypothetical protein
MEVCVDCDPREKVPPHTDGLLVGHEPKKAHTQKKRDRETEREKEKMEGEIRRKWRRR